LIGFAFDVPPDTGYQVRVPVHVVAAEPSFSLTPLIKPPPVVIKRKGRKVSIYFDYDSARLKEKEKRKLLPIRWPVSLYGYASPEGSEEYNFRLSLRRAQNAARYLRERGVKVLEVKGMGEASCSFGPARWSRCRRVEVLER
jgi:outer membrane protein OmpA-like peptidoglycan-associated protein